MRNMKALEGQWYSDRSSNDVFCVIAVDDADGWIDVRDLYGDIDEFAFDEWDAMDLEVCAVPEAWARSDADADDGEEQAGSQPFHHRKSSGTA